MNQTPYIKQTRYLFNAGGEHWAFTAYDETYIAFEETRKNGQEDCHIYGDAEFIEGCWVLDKHTCERLRETYAGDVAGAIEAHFNQYPLPAEPTC